jgi:hypothetical protein
MVNGASKLGHESDASGLIKAADSVEQYTYQGAELRDLYRIAQYCVLANGTFISVDYDSRRTDRPNKPPQLGICQELEGPHSVDRADPVHPVKRWIVDLNRHHSNRLRSIYAVPAQVQTKVVGKDHLSMNARCPTTIEMCRPRTMTRCERRLHRQDDRAILEKVLNPAFTKGAGKQCPVAPLPWIPAKSSHEIVEPARVFSITAVRLKRQILEHLHALSVRVEEERADRAGYDERHK